MSGSRSPIVSNVCIASSTDDWSSPMTTTRWSTAPSHGTSRRRLPTHCTSLGPSTVSTVPWPGRCWARANRAPARRSRSGATPGLATPTAWLAGPADPPMPDPGARRSRRRPARRRGRRGRARPRSGGRTTGRRATDRPVRVGEIGLGHEDEVGGRELGLDELGESSIGGAGDDLVGVGHDDDPVEAEARSGGPGHDPGRLGHAAQLDQDVVGRLGALPQRLERHGEAVHQAAADAAVGQLDRVVVLGGDQGGIDVGRRRDR